MNILEKISEKIEDVRNQPEHIRMRYVWGSVAISMLFVILIWIFSLGSLFQGDKTQTDQKNSQSVNITEQLQELKKQAPSFKDFSEESLNIENEGVTGSQDKNNVRHQNVIESSDAPQPDVFLDTPEVIQAQ